MRARAIGGPFFLDLYKDSQRRLLQVSASQNKKKISVIQFEQESEETAKFRLKLQLPYQGC